MVTDKEQRRSRDGRSGAGEVGKEQILTGVGAMIHGVPLSQEVARSAWVWVAWRHGALGMPARFFFAVFN